jgi:hypothetical protein
MKLAVLLVLAACSSGGGDDYPVGPGGSVGPIGSGPGPGDGSVIDAGGDGGVPQIKGRVCLLTDLTRVGDVTACATSGALGLTVLFGSANTLTTAPDGSFSIDARMESNLVWRANSGTNELFVPSVFPTGNGAIIPMVTLLTYNELLSTNGAMQLQDQKGAIFVQVKTGAARTAKVTATITGALTDDEVRYDGADKLVWNTTSTGAAGVVWIPGVQLAVTPPTVARVALFLNGVTTNQTVDAPIENQAITFVVKNLQ